MDMIGSVASSLLADFVSDLIGSLKKKKKIKDKKEKLEELLIVVHSVIEAAKTRAISNRWLRQWLKNLTIAAVQGDRALAMAKRQQIREEKPSIFSLSFPFAFSPLLAAKSIAKKFISSDEDLVSVLTGALMRLQRACRNAQLFLSLLELESGSKKSGIRTRIHSAKIKEKHRTKLKLKLAPQKIQSAASSSTE